MEKRELFDNCVAIIPARGGSKGIPGKNIMDFCGKPLIAWTIEQALRSARIKSVYVTTDDREIADISAGYGAEIIRRPEEFATDLSTSEDALLHAVSEIEKIGTIDLVVFLQATSPIRGQEDIDNAVDKFFSEKADSLFSAAVLDDMCIWDRCNGELAALTYDHKDRGRRQDREPVYLENGSIYVFKPEILKRYKNRLGGKIAISAMDHWKSFEIDKPEDLGICEYFIKKLIKQELAGR